MDPTTRHFSVSQRLRSPSWESRKQESSVVLLQLHSMGIRILLSLEENGTILALDEIQFTRELSVEAQFEQFRGFIPESLLSEAEISSITISVEPTFFTLLPIHLFSEASAKAALEQVCKIPFPHRVMFENPSPEMVLLFAVPQVWIDWAEVLFSKPELNWTCGLSGLLRFGIGHPENEKVVFANVDPGSFTALVFENGKLLFANRFPYQTENDLLYFLLLVFEEVGMEPESGRVWLSGSILAGSAGYEKLSRYFGNLSFVKNPEAPLEIASEELLRHPLYFDLLTLHQTHAKA